MINTGIISFGVKCPIIRNGDNLEEIVISSTKSSLDELGFSFEDGDIIGITESVVARSRGNYVTVDDIVQFMEEEGYSKDLVLYFPIMSRNRFSMILKAFSRYANHIKMFVHLGTDEVGNPVYGKNPFTGIDIQDYYIQLAKSEDCELDIVCFDLLSNYPSKREDCTYINCMCHPAQFESRYGKLELNLSSILNRPVKREDGSMSGFNTEFGLLGSNKANEETLKLFPEPKDARELVDCISRVIYERYSKRVHVLVYGDGCFKSPSYGLGTSIWEFADPVTCPAASQELYDMKPNELKLKAFADDKYKSLSGEELTAAIKEEISHKDSTLVGNMASQGTTPRKLLDLLASTFDLISGSGDQGCPVVYMKNRFKNFASK